MQYQPLDEELPVGGPSASESGGRPYLPDLNIQQRYHSKLLRALARKHDIVSTKSLVAAYNATTDENERSVLLVWLREYGQRSDECLEANAVLESAELAEIAPVFEQDGDILRQLVYVLRSRIRPDEFLDEYTAKDQFSGLTWMDTTAYDDLAQLIALVKKLLFSLSSEPRLNKHNFAKNEANFLALYQVLFLLQSIGRGYVLEEEKNDLRQVVAQKRVLLELSVLYYPVFFHFKLVQQAVERSEIEDAPFRHTHAKRHTASGLYGEGFHFLRVLAGDDIDPISIEDPYRRGRAAIVNAEVSERKWYDILQILTVARIRVLKKEKTCEIFLFALEAAMEGRRKTTRENEQKALKSGITQELKLLASDKDSSGDGVDENGIRKVPLYGNPGSRKTCIGKAIAHRWALGEMMQDFKHIYVLPIRRLNVAKAKRLWEEVLEEVVAQMWFKQKGSDVEFKKLKIQINDGLEMSNTLLVFDGLDEADDVRDLLSEVEESECKLLILTRPYHLRGIQTRVDCRFECIGFNDQQLEKYMNKELQQDEASRLIHALRQNGGMWETTHTPVTAHILCSLSKAHSTSIENRGERTSMFWIYDDTADFVWKSFEERPEARMTNKNVVFLGDLRKIDVKALRYGQILVEQRIVETCATSTSASKSLNESGFLLLMLEGQDYQFPNLTFQEFFAGKYIAKSLKKKGSDEESRVLEFIQREKYNEKHDLTISFAMHEFAFASAFAERRAKDVLQEMLSIIDEKPVEVLGIQHFFLRMRVLDAIIAEADEDELEDLQNDEQAVKLAKGARQLLRCTAEHFLAREIVIENFKECRHVLKRFAHILHDAMEEMKDLLASAKNLSENDSAKIRNVLKLMKHTPEYNDNIIQLFFLLLNGSGEGCSFEERMKRLALIASEAPHLASNLVPMLEKGCTSPDFFMRKNTIATIEKFMGAVPGLADDLLQMLARGCDDEVEYVRTNAIKAIGNVAKTASHFADLLPMLERTFNDESSYVRRNAMEAIRLIVRETPHLADDLLPMLTKGCNDGVEYVRADAIKAVGDVIGAAPQLADKLLPVLTRRCSEDVEYVRADAIKAVGDVVRAAPHLVDKLLPVLESWSKDENCKVRISAIDAIGSVAGSAPHLAEDFFSIVKKWVDDKHFYVRGKSMLAIGSIVKAAFHLAEDFLPTLKKGCSDKAGYVRWNAIKAIGSVIRATPELAHDLLPVLEIARGDEVAYVRCDAMEAIGHIASVAPDVVIDLLPMLQIRCSHKSYSVRGNAMEDIGRIFKKAPHFADDFLLMLERGSEDNAFFVRQKALEAIQSVVMQAPHLVDKILPMVEKGCNDNCTVVCKTARTLLKSMEPEKVIPLTVSPLREYKGVLLYLFMRHSLTTEDRTIEGGKVSFVLHTTSSELVGEWDKETVDKYLEWLGQEFDKEFPGVLKHLGQANNKLTPYFFSTCVNTMIEVVSVFIEFPYILFILHLLEWCIKLFSLFERMD